MVRFFRFSIFVLLGMVLNGCKIAVSVSEGGKVVSADNSIDCREGNTCVVEVVDTTFNQTLTAVPHHGWEFLGWLDGENVLCASSGTNPCLLTTTFYPGNAGLMTVLASDATYFVIPKFKKLNVDLDEDGVINDLDSDDDNDGVPDIEDNFPHDPTDGVRDLTLGGTLTEDTILTDQGAPYVLVESLWVPAGVTLYIEPGVTIQSNGMGTIQYSGTIVITGTADAKVTLEGIMMDSINAGDEGYTLGEHALQIEHMEMLDGYIRTESLTMRHSSIRGMSNLNIEILSAKSDCYLEFNTFIGSGLGGLMIDEGTANIYVNNNLFSNFYVLDGSGSSVGDTVLTYNTFTDMQYAPVQGSYEATMSAVNNYWGTTDTSLIDAMITDANDSAYSSNTIAYLPLLNAPHPDTPIGP